MAELRNAEAAVETLAATLAALRPRHDDDTTEIGDIDALRAGVQSLTTALEGELSVTMDKFRERLQMVDPVTNEPRFGPKTMARVREMLQRFDALRDEAVDGGLLQALQRRIDAKHASDAARDEARLRAQVEARDAELRAQAEQKKREEQEQHAQRQRELEAEQRRVAELARLAQLKREEREQQRLAEQARAQDEQAQLARRNATARVGVDGLREAVEQLRRGLSGDAVLVRKTLAKLLVLISNVCASPENTAFRHIPKDNAHFHQDIGQHDGGHECLRAMGFKELETEPGKRVFILEEPDLSEDFDKWSAWFDGLKEMKEWIESQLNTR